MMFHSYVSLPKGKWTLLPLSGSIPATVVQSRAHQNIPARGMKIPCVRFPSRAPCRSVGRSERCPVYSQHRTRVEDTARDLLATEPATDKKNWQWELNSNCDLEENGKSELLLILVAFEFCTVSFLGGCCEQCLLDRDGTDFMVESKGFQTQKFRRHPDKKWGCMGSQNPHKDRKP